MQAQPTHVDLFVENYDLLKRWAFQFTEHDKELAEDLLHDTFIHFTLNKPDLESIQNLEGFLFIVMRNLHLSQLRRATRSPLRSFSAVEYDTADMSFWASDPRDRLRMRDELSAICQYACVRKESSKGGSILILRFFHGYYPDEIALVMDATRGAVNEGLRKARAESKLYLEDPEQLGFVAEKPLNKEKVIVNSFGGDLRLELRGQIFNSRRGECLGREILHAMYRPTNSEGPDQRTLAHIVSCQTCIESVNSLLGLPPLASRYPVDTIGKDPGKKGGPGGGAGGGPNMLDSYISRRDAHYYHEPKELCISVNGQFQGLQKIVSGKGEFMLVLDTDESLGFVEVFSELGLRLLMLQVEPPPAGDGKQSAHVELSWGRKIDANLNFSGPSPTLQVTYDDPTNASEMVADLDKTTAIVTTPNHDGTTAIPFKSDKARLTSLFSAWRTFLQPARITAAFAALLIAALLFLKFAPTGKVSAAELLQRSAEAEEAKLANKERVFHRTLNFEERDSRGELLELKRIEVWHSSERGITARRLYDDQGALVMGDWRRADGIQTLYKRGESARLQPSPDKRAKSIAFDEAWQLSATAKEFMALFEEFSSAQVETRTNDYLISYTPQSNKDAAGITKATIVLSKEDLHATEQTFTLRNADEIREFRMVETGYEWKPANAVAPGVFEPNVELTGVSLSPAKATVADPTTGKDDLVPNANTNTTSPAANIATASLEFEVVEALNAVGAFMGEQIGVSRTPDGKIVVTAMVETSARKQALVNALANFKNNPAVRLQIETVAEAQERINRQRSKAAKSSPTTVDRIEVNEGQNPVLAELRTRLSEEEARQFANRMLARSRQARLHALAARQIAERFSATDLQTLTPAERGRWVALVRGHVEKFVNELDTLRRELTPFFPEAAASVSSAGSIGSDAELQSKARELFEASGALQSGLDRSFALTTTSGTPPVKTASFWRSFAGAASAGKAVLGYRPQ